MSFNLNTQLQKNGVLFKENQCVFADSYQGEKSDDVKGAIHSTIALEKILFSAEFSKPTGLKAIQQHGWRELDQSSIIAAPLCLHSHVFQCRKERTSPGDREVKVVSEVFRNIATSLMETVQNAQSQSQPKSVDDINSYLQQVGFQKEKPDSYQNIIDVAEHYLNISKAPHLLLKISQAYLKTIIPTVNPRILELQRFVNPSAMQTPYPNYRSRSSSAIESKEVKERVDLTTYTPRIRRERRTNHAEFLSKKAALVQRSNSMIEMRSKSSVSAHIEEVVQQSSPILEKKPEVVAIPTSTDSSQQNNSADNNQPAEGQAQEGWCVLL